MRNVLVDAGPLRALFARRDKWRSTFESRIRALEGERAQLLTTWPCITEATHMLAIAKNRVDLLRWIGAGAVKVHEFSATDVLTMAEWIHRYSDRRDMDFADATLVWVASRTGTTDILTVDYNDFERYRLLDGRRFSIL